MRNAPAGTAEDEELYMRCKIATVTHITSGACSVKASGDVIDLTQVSFFVDDLTCVRCISGIINFTCFLSFQKVPGWMKILTRRSRSLRMSAASFSGRIAAACTRRLAWRRHCSSFEAAKPSAPDEPPHGMIYIYIYIFL